MAVAHVFHKNGSAYTSFDQDVTRLPSLSNTQVFIPRHIPECGTLIPSFFTAQVPPRV